MLQCAIQKIRRCAPQIAPPSEPAVPPGGVWENKNAILSSQRARHQHTTGFDLYRELYRGMNNVFAPAHERQKQKRRSNLK